MLVQITIASGPFAGLSAVVAMPESRVSLDKLPLELRHNVYKQLFYNKDPVRMSGKESSYGESWPRDVKCVRPTSRWSRVDRKFKHAALLLTNRTFGREAAEFLYRCQDFVFDGMGDLSMWLKQIGANKQYLAHITMRKSAIKLQKQCYDLPGAGQVRLERLNLTLPFAFKGKLSEQMRKQFEDGRGFLLADGVDEGEALRRLSKIMFMVGSRQANVLDPRGNPIHWISPELNEYCKDMVAKHVKEYFRKKRALGVVESVDSSSGVKYIDLCH